MTLTAAVSPIGLNGAGTDAFTIDHAVDELAFGRFQVLLSLFTGLGWMADSMELMILSMLSPILHCQWQISPLEQSLITMCVFAGMMIGAPLWGKICDRFGRRIGLATSSLASFTFGAFSALSPNFPTFIVLRALTGVGIGGLPQGITLYAEFLPSQHRAKCVVLIETFWAVGAAMEALLALLVMETFALGWRWLLLFSSLPLLVTAISCIWVPESARFHFACGRPELARKTLERMAHINGKPMLKGRLVQNVNADADEGDAIIDKRRGHLADLFVHSLRRSTMLLWFIWGILAFAYYGLVLFQVVLFQSGDPCMGGHGEDHHNSTASAGPACRPLVKQDYVDLFSTSLSEFPGLIATVLLLEVLGRRHTMALEFACFSAAVGFLLAFCLRRGWVVAAIFIARASIAGAFQTAFVYTPEIYPTTLRAIGIGTASAFSRLGAILTPFVVQIASSAGTREALIIPIVVYAGASLLGMIASVLLPFETRGRQMLEVH